MDQNKPAPETDVNSSSDIEISAAAINAVIQSVDSDNDLLVAPPVPQLDSPSKQYTSSLLHDFVTKTQLLGGKKKRGSSSSSSGGSSSGGSSSGSSSSSNSSSSSSSSSSSAPKSSKSLKSQKSQKSTKSSKQSISPLPTVSKTVSPAPRVIKEKKEQKDVPVAAEKPQKVVAQNKKGVETSLSHLSNLPKKGAEPRLSSLEKNLFPTERVLYPSRLTKKQKIAQAKESEKIEKINDKQDPLWRQIDISKKFHEPKLSGYKSDTSDYPLDAHHLPPVCSKTLAAAAGGATSGYKTDCSASSYNYRSDCSVKSGGRLEGRKKVRRKRRGMQRHQAEDPGKYEDQLLQLMGLHLQDGASTILKPTASATYSFYSPSSNASNQQVPTKIFGVAPLSQLPQSADGLFTPSKTSSKSQAKATNENDDNNNKNKGQLFSSITRTLLEQKMEGANRRGAGVDLYQSCFLGSSFLKSTADSFFSLTSQSKVMAKCPMEPTVAPPKSRDIKSRRMSTVSRTGSVKSGKSTRSAISYTSQRKNGSKDGKVSAKHSEYFAKQMEQLNESFKRCRIIGDLSKEMRISKKASKKAKKVAESSVNASPSSTTPGGKRRYKKSNPEDHKLPLKKRHYLIASEKLTHSPPVQAPLVPKKVITPKKRHLSADPKAKEAKGKKIESTSKRSVDSPKKIRIRIKPNKKSQKVMTSNNSPVHSSHPLPKSQPPAGVFEPTIDLELQIPDSIIIKADFTATNHVHHVPRVMTDVPGGKVVDSLLTKTMGHLIMKKKTKKRINRTGFPTPKKKKVVPKEDRKPEIIDPQKPPKKTPGRKRKIPLEVPIVDNAESEDKAVQKKVRRMTIHQDAIITKSAIKAEAQLPPSTPKPVKAHKIPKKEKIAEAVKLPEDPPKVPKKRGRKPKPKPVIVPSQSDSDTPTISSVARSTRGITKRRTTVYREALNSDTESESMPLKMPDVVAPPKSVMTERAKTPTPKPTKPKPNRRMTVFVPSDTTQAEKPKKQRRNTIFQVTPSEKLLDKVEKDKIEIKPKRPLKPAKPTKKRQRYISSSDSEPLIHLRKTETKTAAATLNLPSEPQKKRSRKELVSTPSLATNSPFKLPPEVAGTFTLLAENFYGRHVKSVPFEPVIVCNCLPASNCASNCLNQITWMECDATSCPCGENCQNRKIQSDQFCWDLELFKTDNKGWGVRASKEIKERSLIAEYTGEVINKEEMERRAGDEYQLDNHFYAMYLGPNQQIDSHRMGSICRFVNHSCNPNCEMKKIIVLGRGRMVLISLRDIREGEELTYDYNFQLYKGSVVQQCQCGEENCRGQIKQQEPPRRKSSGSEMEVSNRKRAKTKTRVIIHPKIFCKRVLKKSSLVVTLRTEDEDPKSDFLLITSRPKRQVMESGLDVGYSDLILELWQELKLAEDKDGLLLSRVEMSDGPNMEPTVDRLNVLMDSNMVELNAKACPYDIMGFDYSVKILFENAIKLHGVNSPQGRAALALSSAYKALKLKFEPKFSQKVDPLYLTQFLELERPPEKVGVRGKKKRKEADADIIQCICGIFLEEGLMIQCKRCCIWQHVNCVIDPTADPNVDQDYFCEKCGDRQLMPADFEVRRPIDKDSEPDVEEFVSLMRGDLQVRVGDAVYVLRDIDLPPNDANVAKESNEVATVKDKEPAVEKKDEVSLEISDSKNSDNSENSDDKPLKPNGSIEASPTKPTSLKPSIGGKHTYKTITKINYEECDIFRVEKLWKTADGRRMVYGHHHLRPHETFREPTRKFYSNELMQYGLVETIDIDLVMARCWVLDNHTYFKGRPLESEERHVYVCEHKMNKQKRQFDKIPSKQRPLICTKPFAFYTFQTKLRQSRILLPENEQHLSTLSHKKPVGKKTQSASWTALRQEFEARLADAKKMLRSPRLARLEDKCEELLKKSEAAPPVKHKKDGKDKRKEIKAEKKKRK